MKILLQRVLQRPIFKELSWYFMAQVVVQAISFFSVIIVARYLGPTNLGLYSFVLNYAALVLMFIGGMDFYFTWKIAKSEDYFSDVKEYVGHKFNVYVTFSAIGIIAAWVVLPPDVAYMSTIVLAPVFVQALNAFSYYAVATNRAKVMALVQVFSAIILFLIKLFLVFIQAPLYLFMAVAAADLILLGAVLAFYFLRMPEWRKSFTSFKLPSFLSSLLFLYSIRLSIIALGCWMLLLRIDQLILATLVNAYTLGIYSAAVKVAEVPNFLAGVLSTALVSRIALAAVKDDNLSRSNLKRAMVTYLISGITVAIVIIALAPFAIRVLYGSEFLDSVPVLRVYALSIPGMFMNYFFLGMYGATERRSRQVLIFGGAVVVNVALVYILTPFYGAVGAALSTSIAYTLAAIGFYINVEDKK